MEGTGEQRFCFPVPQVKKECLSHVGPRTTDRKRSEKKSGEEKAGGMLGKGKQIIALGEFWGVCLLEGLSRCYHPGMLGGGEEVCD